MKISAHDKEGARADIDAAALSTTKGAQLRLQIGQLYLTLDQFKLAIDQYDLWLPEHPEDSSRAAALNGRCWARALGGRELDAALRDCNAAVRLAPQQAEPLDSRGLVYLRLGRFDRAIADYDAALAIKPKIPWSLYGRGLAELQTGAREKGEADMAASAAVAPHLAERAVRLGIAPGS